MNPMTKNLLLCIFIPIAFLQGMWVFLDARKRGEKYYWLWGLYGLLNVPGSLIIYLLVTRVILSNKNQNLK